MIPEANDLLASVVLVTPVDSIFSLWQVVDISEISQEGSVFVGF